MKLQGPKIWSQQPIHNSQFTIHDSQFIALFSALLFVAHPVQTQAVTYIVQRFTSLATLFYLLSVVMYIKGRAETVKSWKSEVGSEKTGNSQSTFHVSRFSIVWYLLSLISAVCAMKVKEISFTLPIMILLYEFIFFRSTLKRKLLFLIPVLLTLLIVPISVLQVDKPLGEVLSDLSERSRLQTDMPRADYLMTELRVIVTYIRLIFLPVNQNLDYDYPIYRSFFSPPVFLSFLFLAMLFGIALYLLYKSRRKATLSSKQLAVSSEQTEAEGRKSGNDSPFTTHHSLFTASYSPFPFYLSRLIAFGILWFFVALSVESSFIPIVDVIFEHRVYLPSVGAFVALSAAVYAATMKAGKRWPVIERALVPFALIIVLMLSGATFARNRVWKDNLTLWEDVVRKSPNGVRPRVTFGAALLRSGNVDKAIEEFQAALAIKPFSFNARIYLGMAFASKGWIDQAIEQYRMAVMINPESADARNNLGIALFKKGAIEQAIEQYKVALNLKPMDANFHFNLGIAYERIGLIYEAIEEYKAAAQINPSEPAFHQALANASGGRNLSAEGSSDKVHDKQ